MGSKNFTNSTIYSKLRDEYVFESSGLNKNNINKWSDFIEFKNLGIKVTSRLIKYDNGYFVYEIVDEKKWLINKIKYGF